MSFRTRLTWFFLLIVIVPMVAVAVVLFGLVADSERGKTDARLGQAQRSAIAIYEEAEDRAAQAGRGIARSPLIAAAVERGDPGRIERAFEAATRSTAPALAVLELRTGRTFARGDPPAIAPATTALLDDGGGHVGSLRISLLSASELARRISAYTGLEVVVSGTAAPAAATLDAGGAALPARGTVEIGAKRFRVASFSAPGFEPGERLRVHLLADERAATAALTRDSLIVGGLLIAFLFLALSFAVTASRSLQAQIGRLLDAARRLGRGEFTVEVPTDGNDEFAALGGEFNAMARQLEARLAELQTERARLQHAFRRVGESFAKGLDRDALLDIVVQTAVDGVAAEAARATVRDADGSPLTEAAQWGDVAGLERALRAAETAVLAAGEPVEEQQESGHALAHPLTARDAPGRVIGIVSIARRRRPFAPAEKDLFNYLASQVAVSIENVDLHETVQRQAVTDDLTGLFNHRRFQEVVAAEIERAKRFGSDLGLIMLDLDDFKSINDNHGHLQGDLVLREVARVLRETCREVDEPARYGGEEMAVALPGTDLEGAARFAERLRARIEALEVPSLDGRGGPVRTTASFGAAALPRSGAGDKDALVAAADGALYRAKRLGKNRVVKAG